MPSRPRLTVAQLLAQYAIDVSRLPPAPAEPTRQEWRQRLCVKPLQPCVACGDPSATAHVLDTSTGPRWLDLCWEHGWQVENG